MRTTSVACWFANLRSLLLALTFVQLHLVDASPFDPHLVRHSATSPWFEGWFLRLTDTLNNRSVAFITGAYTAPNSTSFSQVYGAVLLQTDSNTTVVQNGFFSPSTFNVTTGGKQVVRQPNPSGPSRFELAAGRSTEGSFFSLVVNDGFTQLSASIGSVSVRLNTTSRTPYSKERPNGGSPEGWLERVDPSGVTLPCNYYVHSLGSQGSYTVSERLAGGSSRLLEGQGLVHMEANWGAAFPDAWLWVQGVRADGLTILMSQVSLKVVGLTSTQTFVSIRGPGGLAWDVSEIDGCFARVASDGCTGMLSINMTCPLQLRSIQVRVGAPEVSFSSPIFFPTSKGFSDSPGCVESYGATTYLRAVEAGRVVVDAEVPFTALEFGGEHRCNTNTSL